MKQTSGKLRFFLISDLCGWLSALLLASVQIRSGSVQPGPHHTLFRQVAVQGLLFSIAVCLLHDVQLRTSNSALCSGIVYCSVTDNQNPSCVWRHICLPQHINYLSKAKIWFYVIIWLFRLQSGFNLGGQNIGFWLAVWMRPVAMQSRSRWHFGQSASSGPFHEKPWLTLIVSQRTFLGGHQEDDTEHNKIPAIDSKEEPQFSGCWAEYLAHEQHHRSQQKQWKSPSVAGA